MLFMKALSVILFWSVVIIFCNQQQYITLALSIWFFLSVYLSDFFCLSIYLSDFLSVWLYLSIWLFLSIWHFLSLYLTFYLSIWLLCLFDSFCLSIWRFLSIYLNNILFVYWMKLGCRHSLFQPPVFLLSIFLTLSVSLYLSFKST